MVDDDLVGFISVSCPVAGVKSVISEQCGLSYFIRSLDLRTSGCIDVCTEHLDIQEATWCFLESLRFCFIFIKHKCCSVQSSEVIIRSLCLLVKHLDVLLQSLLLVSCSHISPLFLVQSFLVFSPLICAAPSVLPPGCQFQFCLSH